VVEVEIMATRSSRPGTTAGTKASEAAGLVTSTVAIVPVKEYTPVEPKTSTPQNSMVEPPPENR
jgi:hypothetical protein